MADTEITKGTTEETVVATVSGSGDGISAGAFMTTLARNNRKIREDRALAITEDAETIYRRKIEDLQMAIKKKRRDREGMLDLSPASADSLVLASDFNAENFVTKDLAMGLELRNLEISLEIARSRYEHLFGSKL